MEISTIIPLLRRFPQNAYLILIGDRGIEDLRVCVMNQKEGENPYYRIDEPDANLPWLKGSFVSDGDGVRILDI